MGWEGEVGGAHLKAWFVTGSHQEGDNSLLSGPLQGSHSCGLALSLPSNSTVNICPAPSGIRPGFDLDEGLNVSGQSWQAIMEAEGTAPIPLCKQALSLTLSRWVTLNFRSFS